MAHENPILFIHDVGAGGLSNAIPELVHDISMGGKFELRNIDNAGCSSRSFLGFPTLSYSIQRSSNSKDVCWDAELLSLHRDPRLIEKHRADIGICLAAMEIWCNEAQERYVLAIAREKFNTFKSLADRERCKLSVVGETVKGQSGEDRLEVTDRAFDGHKAIDLPMNVVFGKPPKVHRDVQSRRLDLPPFDPGITTYLPKLKQNYLEEVARRILQLPSVASKMFLITIGDRTVGGQVARDQLVGPW